MTAIMVRLLGCFCMLTLFPGHASPVSAATSLVEIEMRYELPAAGEVLLVWGVNGWRPVTEDLRPSGTVIRKEVMSTPMVMNDRWVVTIHVDAGATVDYGFLITKTVGGAPVEVWDGHESYRFTAARPEVLNVKSAKLYQNSPVLMDQVGVALATILVVTFVGLIVTAGWLLWSQGRSLLRSNPLVEMDIRFATIVSAVALILGLVVILHHEMWRDELQAWRIATSSHTLSELFRNARYEGHPAFWYMCLYVLSRFSDDPILMQLFHLAIGSGAIFLLCLYAPFTKWQKVCLSFGYFPFYEYLIVSRNYALGVLALCAFCAVQTRWPGRLLICAALLAIMINTSAFGAIIALAFGGWLLLEAVARRQAVSIASALGVVIVLGLGLAVAGMQSTPPPDNSPRMLTWNTVLLGGPLEKTVSSIWRSYTPLPLGIPHFWNTNLLDEMSFVQLGSTILEGRDVQLVLSLGLLGISALLLFRTPSVMLAYAVATGGLLLFLHLKVNHGIRHAGHLFLVFVACLWLSLAHRQVRSPEIMRWGGSAFVTVLFAVHTVAGGLAAATDLAYPFSASRETAEFIERHGLADATMIGSGYAMAAAVAGYLNHAVYYAENKQTGTFVRWEEKRTPVTPADVVRAAGELARLNHNDTLLILTYDLGFASTGVFKLASFERSVLKEERYWLYLMPYRKESVTEPVKS
jgi:hypothetical protein